MKKLHSSETQIMGKWITVNGCTVGDKDSKRIEYLKSNSLIKVAASDDGWDTLYQDKNDGRYWELVYLESSEHGGGPPSLICLSVEEAKKKYKFDQ